MSKEIVLLSLENDTMEQFEGGRQMRSCSMCLFKNIDCERVADLLESEGVGNCNDGGYYGTDND